MKTSDLTIVIPSEIVARPDLSLAERVALAHIHEWPGSSNARLATLLGLSERGVEQMLHRFRQRGLVQQCGKGHARVLRLTFHVERRTNCGENERAKSHTNSGEQGLVESYSLCGPKAQPRPDQPLAAPTQDTPHSDSALSPRAIINREFECVEECRKRADFAAALGHYKLLKAQIPLLPDTPQYKSEFMAAAEEDETRLLACKLVIDYRRVANMPRPQFSALVAAIASLSEAKLSQIRPALDAQAQLGTPADISALVLGETGDRL